MLPWSHKAFRANAPVNSSDMLCRFIDVIPLAYLVYFTFFGVILPPLLAMVVLYSGVFHILRRRLRDSLSRHMEQQTYFLKEQALTKVLTLVLLLFVACWLPLNVMNSVTFFRGPDAVSKEVVYTGILLTHAHSAINPLLYGFRIRRIRDAYLQLWNRLCQLNHFRASLNVTPLLTVII
uniref:G-protein coupled receptors family 1 profile domain-containing protein n=1 Tax=Paramormyrops kingsleyae TaxID=1676925 RepID=A0A3B3QT76_9TELE